MIAGRNFEKGLLPDTIQPVIVNESAIKKFGWTDATEAIDKPFRMGGQEGRVIGVVKDFHFSPLQHLIGPLTIYPIAGGFSRITLKTDISKPAVVSAWVEKTWKKYFPSALLDYDFSDSALAAQYQAEKDLQKYFYTSLFYLC